MVGDPEGLGGRRSEVLKFQEVMKVGGPGGREGMRS